MAEDIEIFTQLLQASGVINHSDLNEAINCARRLETPLENALVSLKLVDAIRLQPIVTAKNMIAAGQISFPLAQKVLLNVGENEITFEEALAKLKTKHSSTETLLGQIDHPLAGYILAAHMVTADQLGQALKESQVSQLPLGRTLVLNRFISRWALSEVIDAVRLMKEKRITSTQAVHALREAVRSRSSIMRTLFEAGVFQGCRGETMTMVELLVLAGLLTEADHCDLEELELVEQKPFTQIIAERQLVEPEVMEFAEALFNMIGNYLKPFQAAEALSRLKTKDISIYQAIAELKQPPQIKHSELRLGDLLVKSGIVSRQAVEDAVVNVKNQTLARIGKLLLSAQLISDTRLSDALRCQSLYREGIISEQQAISCLSCVHTEKIKLEDAFLKSKLHVPNRMQWTWLD